MLFLYKQYSSFVRRKHLNGFRCQKSFTMKASAKLQARKFSAMQYLPRKVDEDQIVVFWSFSESRFPLFNELIQLLLS